MKYHRNYSIAGLPFETATDLRSVAGFMDSYFAAYRSNEPPAFSIFFDKNAPLPVSLNRKLIVPEIEHDEHGNYLILNNSSERAALGYIENNGKQCHLNGGLRTDEYLLSAAIRSCIQFQLERNNGFFLHAACGSIAGRGVVFTGESTAGKTTALHNLHPDSIIAEDAVALRMHDAKPYVHAIPFRGEHPAKTPLDVLCFPRKWHGEPRLTREEPGTVAVELTANALFSAPSSPQLMSDVLATVIRFGSSIPGYNCYFDLSTNLSTVFAKYGILN